MTTDYDSIAEQYQRSKLTPWRSYVECFTLLELIGDVGGLNLIDVACGEGFYTRMLKRRGAVSIIGVDLSQGMVDLAQSLEASRPLGIQYQVGDARSLPYENQFDLAVAAYLLNYAPDDATLSAMCASVARALKPGGRFVTVNCNPACNFPSAPSYRQYGFETSVIGEWRVSAPITWTFYLGDTTFSIENYYLPVANHERALRDAGFADIRWHAPRLAEEAAREFPADFWRPFLGGQGAAPAYAMSLPEAERGRLRERIRASLPFAVDGSIPLMARAWAVRGTRPTADA